MLTETQIQKWREEKSRLLLPIVYVRGFAMRENEIEETTSDPFNGFNIGSALLRTGWTGAAARHIFESPVLRLSQPLYGYRLAFSDGIRGLDAEAKRALSDWRKPDAEGNRPPPALLAIYRYYDAASKIFGSGRRPGMETYAWGLGRLIADILDVTQAEGVYIVAHSMGGLVARTFLQNEKVLNGSGRPQNPDRFKVVQDMIAFEKALDLSQAGWTRARKAVRRLFTYGTPHNGISAQGGFGNTALGPLDALLGLELANFEHGRMLEYLGKPPAPNSLGTTFPLENAFCLVGTAAADYPLGMSRRLVGQLSDGLVEIDNAVLHGPDPEAAGGTRLAARAYVRRAHSGPYGLVNSEEGFGSLSRFLFGDVRIDGDLLLREIQLPPDLATIKAEADKAGEDAGIRASYSFEVFLRVRGARWALTERSLRDGSAIFRKFEELFPAKRPAPDFTPNQHMRAQALQHQHIGLFDAFLDTGFRTLSEGETVEGRRLPGTLGFALRLRAAVPDYEVKRRFWRNTHYEGSALIDQDLVFLTYPDPDVTGGWGLAWGPNHPDPDNTHLEIVTEERADIPGTVPDGARAFRRAASATAIEYWIPLKEAGPPAFSAWLRLTARKWNAEAS